MSHQSIGGCMQMVAQTHKPMTRNPSTKTQHVTQDTLDGHRLNLNIHRHLACTHTHTHTHTDHNTHTHTHPPTHTHTHTASKHVAVSWLPNAPALHSHQLFPPA